MFGFNRISFKCVISCVTKDFLCHLHQLENWVMSKQDQDHFSAPVTIGLRAIANAEKKRHRDTSIHSTVFFFSSCYLFWKVVEVLSLKRKWSSLGVSIRMVKCERLEMIAPRVWLVKSGPNCAHSTVHTQLLHHMNGLAKLHVKHKSLSNYFWLYLFSLSFHQEPSIFSLH